MSRHNDATFSRGVGDTLADLMRDVFDGLRTAFRQRTHTRTLRRLSENQLRDTGLSRPDTDGRAQIPVDARLMARLMSMR